MKFLITGHAGFIGFSLAKLLIKNKKNFVVGIDNFNNYYDIRLKKKRDELLKKNNIYKNFKSIKCDLRDSKQLKKIFKNHKFDIVVNLAAQAGVRYSLKKPQEYISSNIVGFFNLIELVKKYKIKKFVYASSSSVYGNSREKYFKESDSVNKPLQIYAASKITNEALAHVYSHLYNLQTIGLRFFTIYGPWGRPDMAIFKFTKNIIANKKIRLYNFGKNYRDFTYIDDVTKCLKKICESKKNDKRHQIFNIGNNKPIQTLKLVNILERLLNKKAKKIYMKRFNEDSIKTSADTKLIKKIFNLKINTKLEDGINNFLVWYKNYFNLKN